LLSCAQVQTAALCAALMWQSVRHGVMPGDIHLQVP
jgi:hypothetical protein